MLMSPGKGAATPFRGSMPASRSGFAIMVTTSTFVTARNESRIIRMRRESTWSSRRRSIIEAFRLE